MKRLIVLLAVSLAQPAHAWDPVSVFNNAVQGQVNQQIRRGVNEAFRSITTPSTDSRPAGVDIREARPGEVVIYTTPTCGYCTQALAHLKRRNIPYLQKDVSTHPEARAEWQALGGRGVPLALFGSQKLSGFSTASYDNAWARLQAEQPSAPVAAQERVAATPAPAIASGLAPGDVLIARIARVKLLAEARPQGKVLGQLGKQEEVIYLGESEGRYLKVRSADAEGWADEALLAKP